MLKIKVDKSSVSSMEAEGSTLLLAGEMCLAIQALYDAMKEDDEEEAEQFKKMMKAGMEPDSPVWKVENQRETIDLSPELKDAIRKLAEEKQ